MTESRQAESSQDRVSARLSSRRKGLWTFIFGHPAPKYLPVAYKLSLAITLLITGGMVLLGLVVIKNQTRILQAEMDNFGSTVVYQLAQSSKELVLSGDTLGLRVLATNLGSHAQILGAAIYSEQGELLASHGVTPEGDFTELYERARPLDESSHQLDWEWKNGAQTHPLGSFIAPIRHQGLTAGHALVSFSREALTQSLADAVRSIVAATALMVFLGIALSFVMGRRLSRPIQELMLASQAFDRGELRFRPSERRNDEIGHLMDAFNAMAKGMLEKSQVEQVFSRFVSSSVATEILANLDHVQLGGKHVQGAVLFADIVGFTSLSEKLPPNQVAELLNEYFSYISLASQRYRGNIDKFMGDCAMVVFGVPQEDADHAFHSVACAVLIQHMIARLNETRRRQGRISVQFRIGVNAGPMLAGNMGSQERMQYTVVGDAVNLASRLYSVAAGGQIIITEDLYNHPSIRRRVIARRHHLIRLRGKTDPVMTYLVVDLAKAERRAMEEMLREIMTDRSVA